MNYNMSDIKIRNNADGLTKENIIALWHSVGWINGSAMLPERLLNALKNSSTIYTAWDGEKLAGLCSAVDDGLNAWISYMVVDKQYHNQGIGSILIEEMIHNYHDFRIYVQTKNAAGFYMRHGFYKTMTSLKRSIFHPITIKEEQEL